MHGSTVFHFSITDWRSSTVRWWPPASIMAAIVIASIAPSARAGHPEYDNIPVHQRVEPIPPLANLLPSYRYRYNRPTYLGGRISYFIAPSSQEAMAWHRAVHRGYYANHAPRMEDRYFSPKPWQVFTVGRRVPIDAVNDADVADEQGQDDDKRRIETIQTPEPAAIETNDE